jgi:hypothetical protein
MDRGQEEAWIVDKSMLEGTHSLSKHGVTPLAVLYVDKFIREKREKELRKRASVFVSHHENTVNDYWLLDGLQ